MYVLWDKKLLHAREIGSNQFHEWYVHAQKTQHKKPHLATNQKPKALVLSKHKAKNVLDPHVDSIHKLSNF